MIKNKKTSSEVRVKWFVPCGGQHYRFPAQISPYLKVKNKDECYGTFNYSIISLWYLNLLKLFCLDYLKRSNIPNTAKRAKILKNYRKNPDIFKKKLATEMNRISGLIATNKSIKGNSTSAVDIMKIEVKGRISSFSADLLRKVGCVFQMVHLPRIRHVVVLPKGRRTPL